MSLSHCYNIDGEDLVKLAPEVDVTSPRRVREFEASQWRRLGKTLDISSKLNPALSASLKSDGSLGSLQNISVKAIVELSRSLPDDRKRKGGKNTASSRKNAIAESAANQTGWRLDIDTTELPQYDCAFFDVNRETYFHPERTTTVTPECGSDICSLFVGTWPWVYGHSLGDVPVTLGWEHSAEHNPVSLCARLHGSVWTLAGNAGLDARVVVDQYRRFTSTTAAMVAALATEPGKPGSLYRSETGLIRVTMGEVKSETLIGVLGAVSVKAYNHILSSFGAFFRLRGEIMRHHRKLPSNVQAQLDASTDPCIQELRSKDDLDELKFKAL
ncbi:MAG: hypothetical protein ACPG4T_22295 [Nannocystaceae bacterium]